MESQEPEKDPLEERLKQLKPEDFKKALQLFQERIHYEYAAYLNSCLRCGFCSDSCHYYLAEKDVKALPAYKLSLIAGVFKKYFSSMGKRIPRWIDAKDFNKKMVEEWIDSLFGRCTLCARCTLNCTMGINIPYLIRLARGILAEMGLVPPGLQSTVDTAIRSGNNMGIAKEDWIETVQWLEEELKTEVDDPKARLPVDKKSSRVFYTVNPREPMFFPLSILATGKIFYAAQESWTFSSENYDVTNYGLYIGDDEASGKMSERLLISLKKFDCELLALAECGHGFNSNRWEAPEWLQRRYGLEVKSILELIADYIRKSKIRLDPSRNQKIITLHDPCNLVRLGGIVEEQRFILKHAAAKFVEMRPNRENNFCCGGGGGQLAMSRFAERRLKAGKIKADQIKKTGAEVVAAPCHNCIDQLSELNRHYKLGVEVKTISEIVADALVIGKK